MEHNSTSIDARLIAGCMTGTSIDGIDAALVRIHGQGLAMRAEFVRGVSGSLGDLAGPLRALANGENTTAEAKASLARDLSLRHVEILRELIEPGDAVDFVCVHGQTIFHQPPVSEQLIDAETIMNELGLPVIFDLRAADIAQGGQGAPITPIADYILFRDADEPRAIVNLGGYCNATMLPRCSSDTEEVRAAQVSAILAGDVCSCNHWLDHLARKLFDQPFDQGGERAMKGTVHTEIADALRSILMAQFDDQRSLGTGDKAISWIDGYTGELEPNDHCRTAAAAIGGVIAEAVQGVSRILLAGGGVHHAALVEHIRNAAGVPVQLTDNYGVPATYREATAMAVLGALSADDVPITLPQGTGVPGAPPVAGRWVQPA